MPPAGLPALGDDILHYLASKYWEMTPLYDEADISRDAAALMCAGSAFTSALGAKLYGIVSPGLGDARPGGVDAKSSVAEMRALLKEWELPHTGKKGELWARITDEVEGGSEACPISRGAKARAIRKQTERITGSKARTWGLTQGDIKRLPFIMEEGRGFGGLEMDVKTYAIKDVKPVARASGWSWAARKASNERSKGYNKENRKLKEVRGAELFAELARRGHVDQGSVKNLMYMFLIPVYHWERSMQPLPKLLAAAADEVELYYFLYCYTRYTSLYAQLSSEYRERHRKVGVMKMEDEVKPVAIRRALEAWCQRHPSLDAALAHPTLPASMRAAVTEAWPRAWPLAAGGAGAGPSGAGGSAAAVGPAAGP